MSKNSIFKEAVTTDEWYAQTNNLDIVQEVIRVEQGEYGITNINKPIGAGINISDIGTYNIHQCTVIHIINQDENLHGLAHLDGHTEINSLNYFLSDLKIHEKSKNLSIKIFGSSSKETASGLNHSANNILKTKNFLQQALSLENIDKLIEERQFYKDFMINDQGKVTNCLPAGSQAISRAIHSIQALKRQAKYLGTYQIIRADDSEDSSILLDERAIVILQKCSKNPNYLIHQRDSRNLEDYTEIDKATEIILKEWEQSVQSLTNSLTSNINSKALKVFVEQAPIYIGTNSEAKNQSLKNCINSVSDIQRLYDLSVKMNSSTIKAAIKFCNTHDPNLNEEKVLDFIKNKYNDKHKTNFSTDYIEKKSYGGEISITEFIEAIQHHSNKLKALMMINSQGAATTTETPEVYMYKIKDIKELGLNISTTLENIIIKYNAALLNDRSDLDFAKDIRPKTVQELSTRSDISHQDIQRLRFGTEAQFRTTLKRILNDKKIDNFEEHIQQLCNQDKLRTQEAKKIVDETEYRNIQEEFLKNISHIDGVTDFSIEAIATHLANTVPFVDLSGENWLDHE